MNPILFTQILLRILAVYILTEAVILMPQIASFPSAIGSDSELMRSMRWVLALSVIMPMVVGILLWVFAAYIAVVIVGGKSDSVNEPPLTTNSAMGAAISVVGLLVLAIYIPDLIGTWVQYGESGDTYNTRLLKTELLVQGGRVCFGALLLVGVRFWVNVINRFREFGLKE